MACHSANPVVLSIQQHGYDYEIVYTHVDSLAPYAFCYDDDCMKETIIKHPGAGVHNVVVEDRNGCRTSKEFVVFVPIHPHEILTPNGDGTNDVWQIDNIEFYEESEVKIFDRWGKLLATFKGYDNEGNAWDGAYNGHPMPSTDYWYEIKIGKKTWTGHFTLVRQ